MSLLTKSVFSSGYTPDRCFLYNLLFNSTLSSIMDADRTSKTLSPEDPKAAPKQTAPVATGSYLDKWKVGTYLDIVLTQTKRTGKLIYHSMIIDDATVWSKTDFHYCRVITGFLDSTKDKRIEIVLNLYNYDSVAHTLHTISKIDGYNDETVAICYLLPEGRLEDYKRRFPYTFN